MERAQMSFASKQPPKKKRKSRTAFTNHQIFELEKRFLYQKYLSPADRDEIAAQLGLSNAQVPKIAILIFLVLHQKSLREYLILKYRFHCMLDKNAKYY